MLKLENKKVYKMADQEVEALKGVSIEFRKSEFVSILGPSGCGKTTLLNIVGGLDRYSSGDLIINHKSTKLYTDKDWDAYRNHSVGFVFQSYNLIPHQTVLENVELALTLSGVNKEERRKRATAVLKKVGLGDKLKHRPNQLSGGQMQRVAIARALVNDPDIILADEPTGALDTATSEQIMKLLKEISKEKLIVMVTHNPELAEKYSTRIVKLLDGKIIDDSMPFEGENKEPEPEVQPANTKKKRINKTNMSLWMAIMLSVRNLLTKKARTILVSFAGAIGIIGIALVLSISNGFNNYVNRMQEESLASYPITIQTRTIDLQSALMSMFMPANNGEDSKHDKDHIFPKKEMISLFNSIGTSAASNNLTPFYNYLQENKDKLGEELSGVKYSYNLGYQFFKNDEQLTNNTYVYPASTAMYDMIIMYSLDFFAYKANVEIEKVVTEGVVSYKVIINDKTDMDVVAGYFENTGIVYEGVNEINLDATQIIPIINSVMMGAVNLNDYKYTKINAFNEMIDNTKLIDENYTLVAGDYVKNENEAYLVLDKNSELDDSIFYALGLISDEKMHEYIRSVIEDKPVKTSVDFSSVVGTEFKTLISSDYYVKPEEAETYQKITTSEALANATKLKIVGILRLNESQNTGVLKVGVNYSSKFAAKMLERYNAKVTAVNDESKLAPLSKDKPDQIMLYATTFDGKNKIKEFIETYNKQAKKADQITYSDIAGTLMNSLSTIISSITYVLIAFVSVSLIVSSIMIGIITYISVIERTKEIGVLRSVGASKRNVKHVFTAESGLIGLFSGVLGILVAAFLLIPINLILRSLTGIGGLASLPILPSLLLIVISVVLTLIAGVLPARVAAKRDPVVALRSE